ncbi:hypothetical protein SERLA73DRAFT_184052 [Serpula lacrymans var. lacrymans S7.3]|uniref:Uncharacterized protein n=2 Tax=Serpula lacrymans var. lacrymans TaxID=341189 RepID=F8Q2F8_SERL3|nr:uncharacterized protein SERLADRAFT_471531 [Serpula lacrymans var. lacrymans S7.9]EGN97369.1 hypothetical protein SERLA73DRAFT_184052 [Serpula lacrymans var. lacrymans S7.3]EGO22962.1 hypothetical protein SERLADRAFT_471531 [Serpula lacrymans var. lacrymans S7.9]
MDVLDAPGALLIAPEQKVTTSSLFSEEASSSSIEYLEIKSKASHYHFDVQRDPTILTRAHYPLFSFMTIGPTQQDVKSFTPPRLGTAIYIANHFNVVVQRGVY